MKIIELNDEKFWEIIIEDPSEKTTYTFSDKVYTELETIFVIDMTNSNFDYLLLEGPHLNAPNLKYLGFDGQGCRKCIQNLNENGISAPILESIDFMGTGITQIPEFIFKSKLLKRLTFRNEKLSVIHDEIFSLVALEYLSFKYSHDIRVIQDRIKDLVNMECFELCGATIEYVSPELFLLPKIKDVSFAYSSFTSTGKLFEARKDLKKCGTCPGWHWKRDS
jgi:hypothetical protein